MLTIENSRSDNEMIRALASSGAPGCLLCLLFLWCLWCLHTRLLVASAST